MWARVRVFGFLSTSPPVLACQASLSELLRHSAESGLRRIMHLIFERLPQIAASDAVDLDSTPPSSMQPARSMQPGFLRHCAAQEVAAARVNKAAAQAAAAPSDEAADAMSTRQGDSSSDDEMDEECPAPNAVTEQIPSPVVGSDGEMPTATAPCTGPSKSAPAASPARAGGGEERVGGEMLPPPAASKSSASTVPYGVGSLYEVMRFLISLVDPGEAHNPTNVREFGLSLLYVAMQARASSERACSAAPVHRLPCSRTLQAAGASLARVPALALLLSDDFTFALISNIESVPTSPVRDARLLLAAPA